jgi:uncharacterized phage protein (TIGR01671 family)
MRDIKFRAWDKNADRMVYEPYYFDVYHYSDENRGNQQTYRYYEDWRDLEDGRGYECELMQFTGLKDKNGKDIWEDDIIKWAFVNTGELGGDDVYYTEIVEWNECGFFLDGGAPLTVAMDDCEVIGNVHQHKHLLGL